MTKPVGIIAIKASEIPKIVQEISWVSSRLLSRCFFIISADYREHVATPPPFLTGLRRRRQPRELPHLSHRDDVPPRRGVPEPERSEEHTSELQSRGHLVCRL